MIEIIVVIISSAATLLGVIITTHSTQRKTDEQIKMNQAVTETKIDELTREVREHNNFARRMPVMEEKVRQIEVRLDKIDRRQENEN